MISLFITALVIISSLSTGFSQSRYSGKVEISYLYFGFRTITVDAAPNWRGYHLENAQNGIGINLISGFTFKEKLFAGIGIGYLNFDLNNEGINGICVFSDLEFTPPSYRKFSPYLNTKKGYSQLHSQFWNRNENRTGTALVELGAGLRHRLTEKMEVYLQSGILLSQQSAFFPIRIGVHF
ncbi:hypothetical protein ACMA1I_07785 [Pontibacter sp. 13R65]|uniref:hypothetical protein n=1 Tax=Pontibacter sp. 13R65 TaxID=3127458 RepID=UPI00301D92A7